MAKLTKLAINLKSSSQSGAVKVDPGHTFLLNSLEFQAQGRPNARGRSQPKASSGSDPQLAGRETEKSQKSWWLR